MALFRFHIRPISRKAGRSATAAAAYRSGEKIYDERTGEWFDYTRKRGIEHAEIVLSSAAAKQDLNWARDRSQLWNAAERAENRKDSRVAREYLVALPHELDQAQRLELVRRFILDIANRFDVAADFAIHKPDKDGDERNFHAHILTTTREVMANGLGRKTDFELGDGDRRKKGLGSGADEFELIRSRWAALTNDYLAELHIDARIDPLSLEAQGIKREPTKHLGPALSGILDRGEHSIVVERWDREAEERCVRTRERGLRERELGGIEGSILDLTTGLSAALAARENAQRKGLDKAFGQSLSAEQRHEPEKKQTLEQICAQARENWAHYRKMQHDLAMDDRKDPDQENDKGKSKGKGYGRDGPDDDFSL